MGLVIGQPHPLFVPHYRCKTNSVVFAEVNKMFTGTTAVSLSLSCLQLMKTLFRNLFMVSKVLPYICLEYLVKPRKSHNSRLKARSRIMELQLMEGFCKGGKESSGSMEGVKSLH
jgi:hypothetical protein